jgi:hypothetical protein
VSELTPEYGEAAGDRLITAVNRLGDSLVDMSARLAANDAKIDESNAAIKELAASNRRSKKQLVVLGVSVGLDVILSVIIGVFGVQVRHVSQRAQDTALANADTAYNSCVSLNEGRSLNSQLWDFIFATLTANPTNPPTADGQRRIAVILDQVHQTFTPKDCGPDPTPDTPGGLSPATTVASTPPS